MSSPPSGTFSSPIQYRVERLGDKPIRFTGWLLGTGRTESVERGGSVVVTRVRLFRTQGDAFVWAWDRFPDGIEEPTRGELERADAEVVRSSGLSRSPDGVLRLADKSSGIDYSLLVE